MGACAVLHMSSLRSRVDRRIRDIARVKSTLLPADPGRAPLVDAMTRSLDALYARFGLDAGARAAREWIAKIGGDVAPLQASPAAEVAEGRRMGWLK